MPVVLINPFTIDPAVEAAFVEDWQQTAAIFADAPGYLDTQLYRSLDPTAKFRFINIAYWENAETWSTAMKANPPKEAGQTGVAASPALYEPAAGGAVPARNGVVEAQIRALEDQLAQAYRTGDAAALDRLLANDYLVTDGPGTTSTKAKVLDDHRAGHLKVSELVFGEVTVWPLSVDVAIVAGRYHWTAAYYGRSIAGGFRYLRVWARDGQRWRLRAGQVTPLER